MKSFYQCVNGIRSHKTLGYALILAVMLATLVLSLPPVVAGTLDPPADAVTETGAPAPTRMKALDKIPPTWSRILPASMRFKVLTEPIPVLPGFKAWGVLDHETGLVWEKSPQPAINAVTNQDERRNWTSAAFSCLERTHGGRHGWRLPSVHELLSLVNSEGNLPVGHPFDATNLDGREKENVLFWSATKENITHTPPAEHAWMVSFLEGPHFLNSFIFGAFRHNTSVKMRQWCVRGGGPLSAY